MARMKNYSTIRQITSDRPKKRMKKSQLDMLEQEQQLGLPIMTDDDGSISIDLGAFDAAQEATALGVIDYNNSEHYGNLVDQVDPDELARLGAYVKANYETHKQSRHEWESMITQGTSLLGLKLEEKNTPFKGACSAHHPLLMEAAVKFQSKASNELLPANGPVRCKVLGEATIEKEQQANRVAAHMNYQLTEEMTEYFTDAERLLLYVPLFGSGFKKVYYDGALGRPVAEFVPADALVVPNNAPDLYRAECYTHVLHKTRYALEDDFASGLYTKPEVAPLPTAPQHNSIQDALANIAGYEVSFNDSSQGYTLLEQHVTCCIKGLDEDLNDSDYEMALPYIITIDMDSGQVLGIRRNWKENDQKRQKRVLFIHYTFVPGFGFYGFGFLHLLGNLQLSLTSSLRALVDAGQFATLQGGFKLKGVRILNDGDPIYPGQFKDVDAGVLDIQKAIMHLPFKEPSSTLFQMLDWLDMKGQKFADATEQIIGDATNYGPVGTTLALLDASTKFFSAIHKRLHNSLKQELKVIAEINSETLPDNLEYNIEAASMAVSRSDYDDMVDVTPVSDPNVSSNAHRMAKAQTILQVAMQSPQLHDMREVLKHFYTNMDYGNIDKILPPPQEAQPSDPMSDIQMATQGKPIKAFQGQDHKSHIAIKQAFLNDPMSGQNPIMQQAAKALSANIQEHMMLSFMEQVQAQAAMAAQQGQGQQQPMDPAAVMAMAAQQVAQMNQEQLKAELEKNKQNDVAHLLAQAELMDTQTQARKQEFNEKYQAAELGLKTEQLKLDAVKEANAMQLQQLKLDHDMNKLITTKGIESMVEGLRQDAEHQNDIELERIKDSKKPKKSNE